MKGAGQQVVGWGFAVIGLILLLRSPLGPAVGTLLAILLVFFGGVLAVALAWRFTTGRRFGGNDVSESYSTALLPTAAPILIQRGLARLHQGDYEGAIVDFSKAIPLNPDNADLYNNRGFARLQLGDDATALKDLNQAIRLNPHLVTAYSNRGIVRCRLQDLTGGLADYERALALDPTDPQHYLRRGLVQSAMGNGTGAIADFAQALELGLASAVDSANAHCYWAMGLNGLKDYPAAIDHCDLAIQLNPDLDQAYDARGVAYRGLGNYPAALADFDRAIQLNPQTLGFYLNRAGVRLQAGDLQATIADCDYVLQQTQIRQQSVQEQSEVISAHFLCASASAYGGHYQRALTEFAQLEQLEPASSAAHYNLGVVQYLVQLPMDAIATLTQALQLEPNFVAAYYIRGNAYCDQGDQQAALADFRRATQLEAMGQGRLEPEDEHGFYGRSLTRYRGKNYAAAMTDLYQAAKLCQQHHNLALLRKISFLKEKWQNKVRPSG